MHTRHQRLLTEARTEWPDKVQLYSQEVGGRVKILNAKGKKVIEVADMKTAKKLLNMRGYKPDSKSSILWWSKK
jgi:hypothetical protein